MQCHSTTHNSNLLGHLGKNFGTECTYVKLAILSVKMAAFDRKVK